MPCPSHVSSILLCSQGIVIDISLQDILFTPETLPSVLNRGPSQRKGLPQSVPYENARHETSTTSKIIQNDQEIMAFQQNLDFSLDVYLVQNSRYSVGYKGKYNVILSVWSSLSQVREEMRNGAQAILKLFISSRVTSLWLRWIFTFPY